MHSTTITSVCTSKAKTSNRKPLEFPPRNASAKRVRGWIKSWLKANDINMKDREECLSKIAWNGRWIHTKNRDLLEQDFADWGFGWNYAHMFVDYLLAERELLPAKKRLAEERHAAAELLVEKERAPLSTSDNSIVKSGCCWLKFIILLIVALLLTTLLLGAILDVASVNIASPVSTKKISKSWVWDTGK